jgi:MFS family permease
MNPAPAKGSAPLGDTARRWVIAAALMALFLGAMDALIMSAAMPTIITELGGLEVYAWIYSAYFLARAVSLPIFGKLADLYPTRRLFLLSIAIFLAASLLAGTAWSMGALIFARVVQGIGAGGTFALVYIALADVAPEGQRAKTLALASSIWGVASVLGPTLGGFIVTWFSWRWIFFINVPVSVVSMFLIARYLEEVRSKKTRVYLDVAGVVTLSVAVLGLLTLIMIGGREVAWTSPAALAAGSPLPFQCRAFLLRRKTGTRNRSLPSLFFDCAVSVSAMPVSL